MNENQPTIETHPTLTDEGPASPAVWTLLYDGDCALCGMLAGLLAGPTMAVRQGGAASAVILSAAATGDETTPVILSAAKDPVLNDIALADLSQDPPTLVTGAAAWEILIQTEPRLRQWSWLAARLGLTNKSAAGVLRTGAHLSRHLASRICRGCKPLMPLIRKENHTDAQKQEKEAT